MRYLTIPMALMSVFTSFFSFNENQEGIYDEYKDPTSWEYSSSKTNVKIGEEIELYFDVTIKEGWYIYGMEMDKVVMATPTSISFVKDASYELVGKPIAINPSKKFDKLWGGSYTYFKKKGRFVQKVKVLSKAFNVKAELEYQTCTDEICLPPAETLAIFKVNVQ